MNIFFLENLLCVAEVERVQFLVKNLQNKATLKRVLASNVAVENNKNYVF